MARRAPVDWSLWTFGEDRIITPNRCEWLASELTAKAFNYAENVHNLTGDWSGWRVRGHWLISPTGQRVNPLRVRYWLQFGGSCVDCTLRPRTAEEERQLSLF
jgi:hypothetical protein